MNYVQGCFAFIGLILSFVFLLLSMKWIVKSPDSKKVSSWLLAFSAIASIQYIDFLHASFQLFYRWHILYYLVDAVTVLLPVFAYGYMRAHQGHDIFLNKKRMLGHLIPSFIILAAESTLWIPLIHPKMSSLSFPITNSTNGIPSTPNDLFYWCIIATFSLFYWYCQKRHGHQSDVKRWVELIQVILLMTALSVLIKIIAINIFNISISMVYIEGFFAIYFVYTVLNISVHPPFPETTKQNKPIDPLKIDNVNNQVAKISSTSKQLTPIELAIYKEMFKELEEVLKNGAYQDNDLSLGSLAEKCNLTKHQASIAINNFSGCNFYEWVRQYRVTVSKDILAKTKLAVSTIYYDVGFNSKSSFYTAFKKSMGCTPTEYRNSLSRVDVL